MRAFKFRAWHAGNERKTGGFYKGHEPKMLYDIKAGDSLRWLAEGQNITDVMQSTGLLDKNGVEIFEGDILFDGDDCYDQVVYRDNKFLLEPLGGDSIYWEKAEVVGNIYEHPELLNP